VTRRFRGLSGAAVAAIVLAHAAAAAAQTVQATPPRRSSGHFRLDLLGTVAAPVSLGSRSFDLVTAEGGPLTVTRTQDNRIGPGYGAEAAIGFPLGSRVVAEATGSWTRADYSMRVSNDIEDATLLTATAPTSRLTGAGGVRLIVHPGRTEVFVRGAVGWITEIAEGVLINDGPVVTAGGGAIWWRGRPGLPGRRIGLRLDGRVDVWESGFTDGARSRHLSPVLAGGLTIGF
jgi:hypothetical protein